jgi:hypothetical protein
MFNIFRITIKFNKALKNRGGRFLSVYTKQGMINGKVLTNNIAYAKIQRAKDGKVFYVKNWSVYLVFADHKAFF